MFKLLSYQWGEGGMTENRYPPSRGRNRDGSPPPDPDYRCDVGGKCSESTGISVNKMATKLMIMS